jgi:hypothetical protein
MFWLFDKHIEMRANEIVNSQIEHMETKEKLPVKHSSAGSLLKRLVYFVFRTYWNFEVLHPPQS